MRLDILAFSDQEYPGDKWLFALGGIWLLVEIVALHYILGWEMLEENNSLRQGLDSYWSKW